MFILNLTFHASDKLHGPAMLNILGTLFRLYQGKNGVLHHADLTPIDEFVILDVSLFIFQRI